MFYITQNSMGADYPLTTAVVCHDAGAANIIIAGLLETGRSDWRAYMRGPAEKLWKVAYPGVASFDALDSTLEGVELLVTGTGWGSDLEHEARKLARSRGVRSVAVLDHWVNYAERFDRGGEAVWPDEFWVTDDYAMEIAKRTFPGKSVLQVPNCYVETELRDIARFKERAHPSCCMCWSQCVLIGDEVLRVSSRLWIILSPACRGWGCHLQQ